MSLLFKELLNKAIQQSPSADNSQPWLISWENSTLRVSYDTKRVGGKTFPADSPAILLSIGAIIENIKQVASAFNIPIEIEYCSKIEGNNPIYFSLDFKQEDLEKTINSLHLPLFDRHTNRLAFKSKPIPENILEELKKLTLDNAVISLYCDRKKIKFIGKLVQKASEIRFRTQEVHEWLGKSLRFGAQVEETMDGLDAATLDLPPGGSLFLRFVSEWKRMKLVNYLGAYFTMSLIDSAPVKKAPALLAIKAPKTVTDVLQAGQLMEKVWIALNQQGIAVHPYYVICDQLQRREKALVPNGLESNADGIYKQTQALFNLEKGETLQMLFRIGYPKKIALRSKRLPIDKICRSLKE